MKRLTKPQLQERKIYNPYGLAELQDQPKVWVEFTPNGTGRSMTIGGWRVHHLGYSSDPDNKFGSKAFINLSRDDKEEKRLQAIAWATERYTIQDWERSPFGTYHPVGTMDRAAQVRSE